MPIVRERNVALASWLLCGLLLALSGDARAEGHADLTVMDLTASVDGYQITYTATVVNLGAKKSGPFFLEVYPDSAAAPSALTRGFPSSFQQEGIDAGASRPVVLATVSKPNGTYSSWAVVDAVGLVPESDDDNNTKGPITVTVNAPVPTLPELFVSGVTPHLEGDKLVLTVKVYNAGAATSEKFRTNVQYDSPEPPAPLFALYKDKGEGVNFDHFEGLAAGATRSLDFPWEAIPDGIHSSWVFVDVQDGEGPGSVAESNENNNMAGPVFSLINVPPNVEEPDPPPELEPDLVVTDFRATQDGAKVTYEVDVENEGTAASPGFDVRVVYDSDAQPDPSATPAPDGVETNVAEGLAVGGKTTVTLAWADMPLGTHQSWAFVDPHDTVAEEDEGNNVAGPVALSLLPETGVDLRIDKFTALSQGTSIAYNATVTNGGDTASGPFEVDLVLKSVTDPVFGTRGDEFQGVESLGPGESTKIYFIIEDAKPGSYVSWLLVDTFDVVVETDESNNMEGPRVFDLDAGKPLCADGVAVTDSCRCGDNVVQTGYCCADALSTVPCPKDEPDATSGGDTEGGGDDIAVFEPFPDESGGDDGGGCQAAGAGFGGSLGLLLALALLVACLRRRDA